CGTGRCRSRSSSSSDVRLADRSSALLAVGARSFRAGELPASSFWSPLRVRVTAAVTDEVLAPIGDLGADGVDRLQRVEPQHGGAGAGVAHGTVSNTPAAAARL